MYDQSDRRIPVINQISITAVERAIFVSHNIYLFITGMTLAKLFKICESTKSV